MIAVTAPESESEHEHPCRNLPCCENRENGGTVISPSHHLPSTNLLSRFVQFIPAGSQSVAGTALGRNDVRRIFRPKDPLLHPPELS